MSPDEHRDKLRRVDAHHRLDGTVIDQSHAHTFFTNHIQLAGTFRSAFRDKEKSLPASARRVFSGGKKQDVCSQRLNLLREAANGGDFRRFHRTASAQTRVLLHIYNVYIYVTPEYLT